jgi:hypothetical protein
MQQSGARDPFRSQRAETTEPQVIWGACQLHTNVSSARLCATQHSSIMADSNSWIWSEEHKNYYCVLYDLNGDFLSANNDP